MDDFQVFWRASPSITYTYLIWDWWLACRWIKQLDNHFCGQNWHICLLLDNFVGHTINYKPTNICLEPFLANLTSHVQPLDAGIIRCVKAHYRKAFCLQAIELDEVGEDNIYKINLLEVMLMVRAAWDAISAKSITNCWNHCGIQKWVFCLIYRDLLMRFGQVYWPKWLKKYPHKRPYYYPLICIFSCTHFQSSCLGNH